MKSAAAYSIFEESVKNYHVLDRIDQPYNNPYPANSVEHLMYRKSWIDTIQWHYEDLIRDPNINPVEALALKRKIDASNQDRTDTVEYIDSLYPRSLQQRDPSSRRNQQHRKSSLGIRSFVDIITQNLSYARGK
ncbi:MAG: hypothetical protein CM15mP83_0860 [Flavobacteriaceae bacterium]|nr:MAG: hypothetical protein CM15mP83_0860 [Flavobacteriaceae bacterium]